MKFADLVSLLGIGLGTLMGVVILLAHRRSRPSALLGLFIITIGLRVIPLLLVRLPFGEAHPIVVYLPFYTWYLGLPLLYLYTRQLIGKLCWSRDWLHLIPGILEFVIISSLFLLELGVDGRLFGEGLTRGIIGVYTIMAIGPVMYYSYLTVITLERHQKLLLSYYSNLTGKNTRWIRTAIFWLIAQALVYTLMRYGPLPLPHDWRILFGAVSNTAVIFYLSYYGIRQLRLLSVSVPVLEDEASVEADCDPTGIQSTFERMETHLRESKAYLNPNLTIQDLAGQLYCSKRTLSRVLSTEAGKHFNEYINCFRVAMAKQLLRDARFDHYTMEAIAGEAGFNSKATFYQAFKRESDVSPAVFRRTKA